VEVKVQQRRPDGGSIPPIARIFFLLFFGLLVFCTVSGLFIGSSVVLIEYETLMALANEFAGRVLR
jgi:hypothetical protein